ncbi:MAG: ABC transporter permease [Planctomycetota bacterium]
MKPIEAENQVALGMGRCVRLAINGMSYRLFRSLVTISILALAVAFLVHMLAYGLISSGVESTARERLEVDRRPAELLARLNTADIRPMVIQELSQEDSERRTEYRTWLGDDGAFEGAVSTAEDLRVFEEWLDGLPAADRAALTGGQSGPALFEGLVQDEARARLIERLEALGLVLPLGGSAGVDALFAQQVPVFLGVVDRVIAGQWTAIAGLREVLGGGDAAGWFLAEGEDAALRSAVEGAGYGMGSMTVAEVRAFAARTRDLAWLDEALRDSGVRGAAARRLRVPAAEVTRAEVLSGIGGVGDAAWLAEALSASGLEGPAGGVGLSVERLAELAQLTTRSARLEAVSGDGTGEDGAAGGFMGLPVRTLWLVGLSFLVCVVGVANAMLMSVTERFTEIATIKCLGAMDRFVMLMFVFEAAIQGVVGGVIGVVLGLLLAGLRGLVDYGSLVGLAWGQAGLVVVASGLAFVVGLVLATVAAVGPSFVAARLAPMEAMRVE